MLQPLSQQLGNGGFWESHIDRYIQGQLLVGPVSGGLFLILAILALPRLGTFPAWLRFLLLAGLGAWAGGLLAGDSNLGYARNWDLQAPLAIIVAIAIVALLARLILPKARRGVLLVLVVVSILHTLPWILLNADEATALQPRAL